jgi:hypothetical protein
VTTTFNSANIGVHISDFRAYGTLHEESKGSISEKSFGTGEESLLINEEPQMTIKVYPNPFIDNIAIEVCSHEKETFDLSVFDISGRILLTRNDLPCNMSNFLNVKAIKGIYILRISVSGEVLYKRIVKQ